MKKQLTKIVFSILSVLYGHLTIEAQTCTYCSSQVYSYSSQWGSNGTGNTQFDTPKGIAVDGSGNVYVADAVNDRVQKFNSSGTYVATIGSGSGSGDGYLDNPTAIAIDASGNIYIVDSGNNRVQKFNGSTYAYISKFGTSGSSNGQFNTPIGIAIHDGNGKIYVSDYGNNRIQVFTSSGTYSNKWGSSGSASGKFSGPAGIAMNSGHELFVADYGNDRIQKFDHDGTYVDKWGSTGSGDGQFSGPWGIGVDNDNKLHITDTGNNRVKKYSGGGAYQTQFGSSGTGNGQFDTPYGVAVGSSCQVYVADGNNDRIQVFTPEPEPTITSFSSSYTPVGSNVVITGTNFTEANSVKFNGTSASFTVNSSTQITAVVPVGVTTGAITVKCDGSCNTATSSSNFVIFSCTGATYSYNTQWGTNGTGNGEFGDNARPFVDASGNVFVADYSNHRIQKFTSAGSYTDQFGSGPSSNDGYFNSPKEVIVDGSGNIYVLDAGNYRVQKFNSSFTYQLKWGQSGTGNSQFTNPNDISIDPSGNICVLDFPSGNTRIQKFNSSGTYQSPFTITGVVYSDFAIDNSGNYFFIDYAGPVDKYSSTGSSIGSFGSGDFYSCTDIFSDAEGNIYVTDGEGVQCQKFDNSGDLVATIDNYGVGCGCYDPLTSGAVNKSSCDLYLLTDGGCFLNQNCETIIERWGLTQGSRYNFAGHFEEKESIGKNAPCMTTLNVKLYPNPSIGTFTILVPGENHFKYELFNPIGESIMQGTIHNNTYQISDADLSEGLYTVKVSIDGRVSTHKLVISK